MINGQVSDDIKGCTLLYAEDILSKDIYYDESMLAFEDNFDYSGLSSGILPKLKNDITGEILPNQKDLYLKEDKLSIKYLEFSKGENINIVNVAVEINNPNEVVITGLEVDDMNINITSNTTENGITYIRFTGTAIYYYDNYKISKIKYMKNEVEEYVPVEGFIDARLYKAITSFVDWEAIDDYSRQNYRLMVDLDFTGRSNVNNNVSIGRLEAEEEHTISGIDLTFAGNSKAFIKEITKSIKNINFENCKITNNSSANYVGLIGKISGDIDNISFSNIEVTGKNVNRVGLIFRCASMKINNVNLESIQVTGKDYVGGLSGIADSGISDSINAKDIIVKASGTNAGGIYGYVKQRAVNDHSNFTGEDITVTANGNCAGGLIGRGSLSGNDSSATNCTVTANNYAGGLIGYSESRLGNNFTANHCTVTARTTYAGGLFGYANTGVDKTYYNFTSQSCIVSAGKNSNNEGFAGGVFGYFTTYIRLNNVKVDDATISGTGHYVGGVSGYQTWGVTHNYMYVTNTKITGGQNYIGGIFGWSNGYLQYCYVKDVEITGNGSASSYVGGISGNTCGITRCNVNNTTIESTGSHVGGIVGYIRDGRTVQYSAFENSIVKGGTNVGGVAGTLRFGYIAYCHANGEIISTGSNAGGIVGYLDNTNNNIQEIAGVGVLNNASYIRWSAVMRSTVTGNNYVGGFVGKEYQPILTIGTNFQPANYYYSNYIDADVTATTNGTKIVSMGIASNPSENRLLSKTYFYKYSKLNGEYVYNSRDLIDEANYLVLSDLKNRATYTSKLGWTADNNLINTSSTIINTYYPKQSTLNSSYYNLIELPNESALLTRNASPLGVRSLRMISMSNGISTNLPSVEAYAIDVDKINLEFSRLDENTYFYIVQNDLQLENQYLNEDKVFSYQYDFKELFNVIITDGVDTNIITINPKEISVNLSVNNNQYYYLIGDKLYLKNTCLGEGYLNLYNDKVLKNDNNVYLLENMAINTTLDSSIKSIDKEAFAKYDYNSYKINTYKNYSEVINGDVIQQKSYRLFVRNNKLYSLSNNLNIKYNGIILDYYNQNEYETVLGNDGALYDLKTTLNYPKDFKNSNIEEISTNIFESNNVMLVKYIYGRVYAFNYVTGEELYDNGITMDVSLKDYIVDKFTSDEIIMSNDDIDFNYQNSLLIKEKLEELPISEFVEDTGIWVQEDNEENQNSSTKSTKYVSVYEPDVESYVIYDEEELLASEKPITENSKIQGSAAKTKYYLSETVANRRRFWKGSTIVLVIIGVIIINLGIMFKINNEKTKKKSKKRILKQNKK